MRLSRASIALLFPLVVLILFCGACGSSNTTVSATSITLPTTNISLTKGDTYQLTPTASDKTGKTVSVDYVYSSTDPATVSVSPTGLICAGSWNVTAIVCTPAVVTASTKPVAITISAKNSVASIQATVVVHEAVDSIQVTPPLPGDCRSSADTLQLQATAYSNSTTVCNTYSTTPPCALPAATIGEFTWFSANPSVVTVDNTTTPTGLATAQAPGTAKVYATLGSTNSPNVVFTTCPIVSLQLTRQDTNDTTPFAVDTNGTKILALTAIDSKGKTLTAPLVAYNSTNAYSLSVLAGSNYTTATVTGLAPASTGVVSVSCTNPGCNTNLTPVWGAPIVGTVNGTSNGTLVYAASTKSTSMYPIDGTTLGTQIVLPRLPNSFLMNRQGTNSILGSDVGGLMFVTHTSSSVNTVSSADGITGGKALAISPYGILAAASTATDLYIINLSTLTVQFDIKLGGITSFDFAPGASIGFASKGDGTIYSIDLTTANYTAYPTAAAAVNGIAFVDNGPIAYVAQPGGVNEFATCSPSSQVDSQAATAPTMLQTLPTGQGAVAIDGTKMIVVHTASITQACPPVVAETSVSFNLGLGTATPAQVTVTLDSTKAIVTSSSATIAIADIAGGTATPVTLAAGATASYRGGVSPDSKSFFVGGSDGTVHRIDLAGNTDAQQITVGLKQADGTTLAIPDLVQVKGK